MGAYFVFRVCISGSCDLGIFVNAFCFALLDSCVLEVVWGCLDSFYWCLYDDSGVGLFSGWSYMFAVVMRFCCWCCFTYFVYIYVLLM